MKMPFNQSDPVIFSGRSLFFFTLQSPGRLQDRMHVISTPSMRHSDKRLKLCLLRP